MKPADLHNLMLAALVARGFADLARKPEVVMAMCDAVGEYAKKMGHGGTENAENGKKTAADKRG